MKSRVLIFFLVTIIFLSVSSCYKEELVVVESWTEASHSSSASPGYATVFNESKVNRLDLVIDSKDWKNMQENLDEIVGSSSGGGKGGGMMSFSDETPQYFPCDLTFNGVLWPHVGIRYKGNSSLNAYSSGAKKLPLRLEFDKFENDYPEIENMRFYGFKELSLSSNYNDESLLREKIAPDLFRSFGVPAPRTAFYEIHIDYGEGSVFFGVYTMIEVVFDSPMLSTQFDNSTGNCYKPDGDGAAFSTANFNLDDIEIKNHDFSDKSDVQEFYDVLHDSDRENDPTEWRLKLEPVFDVEGYLKYLAVNTTIQNWDTYGLMTHNYYLYHDPTDDLIKWIPWDNNEAFQLGKQGGSLSFEFTEVSATSWPIIRNILDDEVYRQSFNNYVERFKDEIFNITNMTNVYENQSAIVSTSASKESGEYTYLNNGSISEAVNELINHSGTRNQQAQSYLDSL